MSDSLPPPPGGPTQPPPGSSGETLSMAGGEPAPQPERTRSGATKVALLAGGAVALAGVGAGAWAAMNFFSTGVQPAEALPASTLAYAAIDLDPSGGQKIEAVRTLNKFPAFKDELDLDTDDDVLESLFQRLQQEDECPGLDYAQDVQPWLGMRLAVAAIDSGEEEPDPVFVLQVKDADAAETGLRAIEEACGGDGDDDLAWVVDGDWAVVAETDAIAEEVAEGAAAESLADDSDFGDWTGRAGEAGIVTMYLSPAVGDLFADNPDLMENPFDAGVGDAVREDAAAARLRSFQGAAAVMRFADGALEMEAVGGGDLGEGLTSDQGAAALATMPADTAVAFGFGLSEGWLENVLGGLGPALGMDAGSEELWAEAEAATGLALPEDIETLFGTSTALGLGADFDPEEFFTSGDPSGLPVAIKIQGSPVEIEDVLDTLRAQLPPDVAAFVDSDTDGSMTVIGPDADHRERVLEEGGLGEDEVFRDVVREADRAGAVLFVNVDEFEDAIADLVEDDDVAENLAPLSGFGITAWAEGDTGHLVVRVTTD